MSPLDFEALYSNTDGCISLTDSSGEWRDFDTFEAAADHVERNPDCLVDLVTSAGEAIGVALLGDASLVEPKPSVCSANEMVFLLEDPPALGQPRAHQVCPAQLLAGVSEGRVKYPKELQVTTAASNRQIKLMRGRRRDEPQGKWKEIESTFDMFADILMRHAEGPKDGPCFLQGRSASGARKSAAQIENFILGVDLDSGAPLGDVMKTIQEAGLEAVIYTTHSHCKATSVIKRDHFLKKMGATSADEDLIRQYLIEYKGVLPQIVEELDVIEDGRHTEEGVVILVQHKPMPKFRAVFPLSEPFVFAKRGGSQQDAILEWKERYAGFCTELGFFFDEKCVDPARLFYFPRHPAGNKDFRSLRIIGKPLDLLEYDRVKLTRRNRRPAGPQNAFMAAGGAVDDEADRYITNAGFNLRGWAKGYAKKFEVQAMLEDVVGGDFIREDRGGKSGVHVECPFEAEHSSFGGNGTFVVNAGDNYEQGFESGFAFVCQHNACHGRDRLDFIKQLLDSELIASEDLTNKDYLLEFEDDDSSETPKDPGGTFETSAGDSATFSEPSSSSEAESYDQHLDELKRILCGVITSKGWRVLEEPTAPGGEYKILTKQEAEHRHAKRAVLEKDGSGKVVKRYPFRDWLESPDRRDFEGLQFAPGLVLKGMYNTFTGWPVRPIKGDYPLLKEHMRENLCEGNAAHFNFLFEWLAHIVQCPASKPGSAIVISGDKGCGKSIVLDFFQELMGRYNVPAAHKNQLVGNFNGHLEGKLLMVGEELSWAEDVKAEGVLKDFITNTRMSVEKKGVDAAPGRNYTRLVLISNSDWQVPATLRDERRFLALRCNNARQGDHSYFGRMRREMDSGGLEALMYDLLHHVPSSPDWSLLRKPPVTAHLQTQQRASLDPISSFLIELIEQGSYEFERDSEAPIILDESRPTPVASVHLRAAAREALKHTNGRINSPEISMRARQLCGARERKELSDLPGTNKRTEIVFPPLRECRQNAQHFTGLPISGASFDG